MANERRLIDADELKSYINECSQEGQYRVYAGYASGFIDNAPTVAAIIPVRCEECKYQEDCIRQIEFIGRNPVLNRTLMNIIRLTTAPTANAKAALSRRGRNNMKIVCSVMMFLLMGTALLMAWLGDIPMTIILCTNYLVIFGLSREIE